MRKAYVQGWSFEIRKGYMSYDLKESVETFSPRYYTTAIRAWNAMLETEFIPKIAFVALK